MYKINTPTQATEAERLRDTFAGQAIIGLLAGGMVKSKVADAAYAIADSMLVAREAKHAAQ